MYVQQCMHTYILHIRTNIQSAHVPERPAAKHCGNDAKKHQQTSNENAHKEGGLRSARDREIESACVYGMCPL